MTKSCHRVWSLPRQAISTHGALQSVITALSGNINTWCTSECDHCPVRQYQHMVHFTMWSLPRQAISTHGLLHNVITAPSGNINTRCTSECMERLSYYLMEIIQWKWSGDNNWEYLYSCHQALLFFKYVNLVLLNLCIKGKYLQTRFNCSKDMHGKVKKR